MQISDLCKFYEGNWVDLFFFPLSIIMSVMLRILCIVSLFYIYFSEYFNFQISCKCIKYSQCLITVHSQKQRDTNIY